GAFVARAVERNAELQVEAVLALAAPGAVVRRPEQPHEHPFAARAEVLPAVAPRRHHLARLCAGAAAAGYGAAGDELHAGEGEAVWVGMRGGGGGVGGTPAMGLPQGGGGAEGPPPPRGAAPAAGAVSEREARLGVAARARQRDRHRVGGAARRQLGGEALA